MALLFFDGFDHYGIQNLAAVNKYGVSNTTATGTPVPRTGTGCMRILSGTSQATTKVLPVSGGFVVGGAFYSPSFVTNDFIQILEGAIVHVAVASTAGGLLTVKRGSTVLATGTTVLAINGWYYIEIKGTIHDTTGDFEVYIDGVQEVALTMTGQDTRNAGTGVWDRVNIGGQAGGGGVDDFYVCDQSGSAPRNTFLGPVKVETIYPQTDAVAAGSNAGLTCSTGTDHGALVDEVVPNTTDYNSSPTVGLKDTYNYPAMALSGTIFGVQTNLYVAKSDATARQVCAVVRAGGVDYDGANISPTTTFVNYNEIRVQNPNTVTEWIVADIATIQAGMKVTL